MEPGKAPSVAAAPWPLRVYAASGAVWLALQLQFLWLIGAAAGGVLLGWAPATVAASTLARDHERGEQHPAWRRFWTTWRAEFAGANLAAAPLTLLAPVVAVNLLGSGDLHPAVASASWVGAALLAGSLCWFGPLYAHYDLPRSRHALTTLQLVVGRPLPTLLMLLVTTALVGLTSWSTAVGVFVAVGAWIAACTHVALGTFAENEERLTDGPPETSIASILPTRPLEMH